MALGVELCYILKYVEMDAGSSSLVPWSIRQMVIYQKLDMNTQETTCIIIQPSADVRRRKDEVAESTKSCQDLSEHWTSLHSLLLGTLNRNWASYLKCLDIEVEKLHTSFHSATVPKIGVADMQRVSKLVDLLFRFTHVSKLNMEVFHMLLKESKRREVFDKEDFCWRYRALEWAIDSSQSETKLLCDHGELVLSRANNVASMVSLILPFDRSSNRQLILQLRNILAIEDSQKMQEIVLNTKRSESNTIPNISPRLSRDVEQDTLTSMSHNRDARSMRTITLVTLLYLPLIFTSTFLSMGFIHVTSSHSGLTVKADDGMWFYLALTLPLLVVTIGVWYIWEWRARRRLRAGDIEGNVKIE
ncbi:hypothetical protein EG329_007461 [Mollisiaceae sp. DMI_Dod_QoI]|nr:hypothetical protein EG329_007461 [Helotiales sp. DMI_Dod_QoI]